MSSAIAIIETMRSQGHSEADILAVVEAAARAAEPIRTKRQERNHRYYESKKDERLKNRLNKTSESDAKDGSSAPYDINNSTPTISEKNSHTHAREFAEFFWPKWPNKTGKPVAERAFAKARQKHALQTILDGVDRYISGKPADRSWLNPATFLNQERFLDEPAALPFARAGPKQRETAADVMAELRERAYAEKSGSNRGNNEPTGAREPCRESPTLDLSKPTGSEPWGAGFDFVESRAYTC